MSERPRRLVAPVNYRRLHMIGRDEDSSEDEISEDEVLPSASSEEEDAEEENVEESTSEEEDADDDYQRDLLLSVDGTKWTRAIPTQPIPDWRNIRVNFQDGPKKEAKVPENNNITKAEIFNMFFTDEVQMEICNWTNKQANLMIAKYNDQHPPDKHQVWADLTPMELKSFVGLIILLGIEKGKRKPLHEMWSKNLGIRVAPFTATMSRTRFYTIMSALRFDDAEKRRRQAQRGVPRKDKFEPIREVFQKIVGRFQELYEAAAKLCIDEELVSFRGRCPFRVYMPDKSGKYGLRIWALVDNASEYILQLQVYEGKRAESSESQEHDSGARGRLNTTQLDLGGRVVLDLIQGYEGTGRGLIADNFFSSFRLVSALLDRKITYCGTLRKNRREVPAFIRAASLTGDQDVFLFNEDHQVTLLRHNHKGRRFVLLISSTHYDNAVRTFATARGEKKLPEIIDYYNCNKFGVDSADYMISSYSGQFPTRRWPMKIFVHLLDCMGVNSFIIWTKNDPHWKSGTKGRRRIFLRELAYELIMPQIRARAVRSHNLQEYVRSAMIAMGVPFVEQEAGTSDSHGTHHSLGIIEGSRCHFDSPIDRKRKRADFPCSRCKAAICKDHRITFCPDCVEAIAWNPQENP